MLKTNLGNFSVLEVLLLCDGFPINVRLVSSMLDNGEEEHGLRSRGLSSLAWSFVGHGVFSIVSLVTKRGFEDELLANER